MAEFARVPPQQEDFRLKGNYIPAKGNNIETADYNYMRLMQENKQKSNDLLKPGDKDYAESAQTTLKNTDSDRKILSAAEWEKLPENAKSLYEPKKNNGTFSSKIETYPINIYGVIEKKSGKWQFTEAGGNDSSNLSPIIKSAFDSAYKNPDITNPQLTQGMGFFNIAPFKTGLISELSKNGALFNTELTANPEITDPKLVQKSVKSIKTSKYKDPMTGAPALYRVDSVTIDNVSKTEMKADATITMNVMVAKNVKVKDGDTYYELKPIAKSDIPMPPAGGTPQGGNYGQPGRGLPDELLGLGIKASLGQPQDYKVPLSSYRDANGKPVPAAFSSGFGKIMEGAFEGAGQALTGQIDRANFDTNIIPSMEKLYGTRYRKIKEEALNKRADEVRLVEADMNKAEDALKANPNDANLKNTAEIFRQKYKQALTDYGNPMTYSEADLITGDYNPYASKEERTYENKMAILKQTQEYRDVERQVNMAFQTWKVEYQAQEQKKRQDANNSFREYLTKNYGAVAANPLANSVLAALIPSLQQAQTAPQTVPAAGTSPSISTGR